MVFCEDLKRYVKIIKINEGQKTFDVMDTENETADGKSINDVSKDRLTKFVTIYIKVVDGDKSGQQEDLTVLKMNVNAKVQKIYDILSSDQVGGTLVHGKTMFLNEKLEQTVAKANIKNGDKFAMVAGGGGGISLPEPIRWRRCDKNAAYNYIFHDRIDVIMSTPKVKVWFMGFG